MQNLYKILLLSIILLMILFPLYAQSNIDSLLKILKTKDEKNSLEILNLIAEKYIDKSLDKSYEYASKALSLAKKYNNKKEQAKSLNLMGLYFDFMNDSEKAIDFFQKSNQIFTEINDKEGIFKTSNNIATAYIKIKKYNHAIQILSNNLVLAEKINDNIKIADTYYNLGLIHSLTYDYYNSIEYYQKAKEIYIKLNDKNNILNTFNDLIFIYRTLGDYDKVIEYSLEALKIYEEQKNTLQISNILNKIGNVYFALNNYDKALEYLEKALKISYNLNDKKLVAKTLNNIGNVYFEKKDFPKALDSYSSSLKNAMELGDMRGIGLLYNNIGQVYAELQDYKLALHYSLKSLEIKEISTDTDQLSNRLNNIGIIYYKMGDYEKAYQYAKKALDAAYEKNNRKYMLDSYSLLYEIYESMGNYKNALNYHKLYTSIKDSIASEEIRNQISAIEIRYETEKKEKENQILKREKEQQTKYFISILALILIIAVILFNRYLTKKKANKLLTQKNEMIRKANLDLAEKNRLITQQKEELQKINIELLNSQEKLREALATKDKFFSIIAHDLKNPLQAMILSSYTLANNYHRMSKSKLEDSFYKLHKSSNYLSELLENLLQWARTQSGAIEFNPDYIDLSYIADNNVNLLYSNASRKNIKINQNILPKTIVYADLNMISSVFRNILTNAVKFSNEGGEINIYAKESLQYIEVIIEDNGIGIKEEDLKKLFRIDVQFTTQGTMREKGTGLGLILCKEFIEKNGGKIWAESEYGIGSKFHFILAKHQNGIKDFKFLTEIEQTQS